ncbi:MAG TPA: NmrA/HSCARG family protein [Segetibacter sp.]|nr:NmrA/HSCARG family protein [Segetibacter sp.]
MPDKKIIVVFGATGAQGGGLAHAILNDENSEFAIRAVTRDGNSDKAQQLAQKGAEVVTADIDDPDALKAALKGAYGAYFVTFFWSHMSPEREMAEAKVMADAAKEAGLKHVIWSTLEDTRQYIPLTDDRIPTLMEKYKVPHFDAKGESDRFFIEAGVPTTFLLTSFYYDNFIYFGMGPKKGADDKLLLTLPLGDRKLAMIAAEDIGKAAYGIFKKGEELIGKTVGIAGDHQSGAEMAKAMSSALGKEVEYNKIPSSVYRSFGFPGADDLGNMFQFNHDFANEFNGKRDLNFTKMLNPEVQSFDMWLKESGQRIPLG